MKTFEEIEQYAKKNFVPIARKDCQKMCLLWKKVVEDHKACLTLNLVF